MKKQNGAIFMEHSEYKNQKAVFEKEQREAFEKYKAEHKDDKIAEMSLYDCNRSVVATMGDMTSDEIFSKQAKIEEWFEANSDKYYMFLCNELHYFTVFHQYHTTFGTYSEMTKRFMNLLIKDICNIKAIDIDTNGALAVWGWQKEENELPHCFYLFPYSQGVIEV